MTEVPIPDPAGISSWPAAIVAVALIVSMLVIPSVLTYLSGQRFKEVRDTLTNTNGGSTVKDALNRIEDDSAAMRQDVAQVAVAVGSLRAEFDAHLRAEQTPPPQTPPPLV